MSDFDFLTVECHSPKFRGHAFHRRFKISCVSDVLRVFKYVAQLQRRVDVISVYVFGDLCGPIISILPASFSRDGKN